MLVTCYNIVIHQGATWTLTLRWLDAAGAPQPLVGATARMQVRRDHTSAELTMSLTTETGGIVIDPATGTIALRVEALLAENLPAPFRGVYDLEVEQADGTVTRLIEGRVTITPEVTRWER